MRPDEKNPGDAPESSKHLWVEYKYRHDLIWQRIFRFTTVYALMAVVPYVQQDVARLLGYWILIAPLLALLFALVSLTVMSNELAIFGRIKQAYRRQQSRLLGEDLAHLFDKKSRFDAQVKGYFGVLILLAIVNGLIVWRVFIPGLLAQPVWPCP
jgi:hypothetical protein